MPSPSVAITSKSTLLSAENLQRSFIVGQRRIEVLRGISVSVSRGEIIFLCGSSGAGKSTLLYTLAGLEKPEQGKVLFDNKELYRIGGRELSRIRNERMGFVFQSYHLLPELTALENVALPSLINGKAATQTAEKILGDVGLSHRLHHLPAELSGGEQQRVAIARSMINDPSIIFADEPTGNLDSKNGAMILNLLLDLVQQKGRTLLVVTHDPELAKRGDRRLMIVDGQLKL